jgi:hypothetical protein
MSDRFAAVPRGQALSGSRAIAEYMLGDADKSETVVALPREEVGLIKLGRELVGYTGWIDFALAARASAGKSRQRERVGATHNTTGYAKTLDAQPVRKEVVVRTGVKLATDDENLF